MKRSVVLLLALTSCTALGAPPRPASVDVSIVNVTIVDTEAGRLVPGQTILIRGNRIVAVDPAATARGTVIDGTGKYAIPGLWDMHVHLFNNGSKAGTNKSAVYFPLLVANGITGVRDMWTDLEDLRTVAAWQDSVSRGTLLAPRVIPTSPIMDGAPRVWPNSLELESATEARRAADSLAERGVRTFKVYGRLSPSAYRAIAGVARQRRLYFEGHLPDSTSLADASNAGQRTVEHLGGAAEACSTDPARLVRAAAVPTAQRPAAVQAAAMETFAASACAKVAEILARNTTWLVPTIVGHRGRLLAFDTAIVRDPRLRYMDAATREAWTQARPGTGVPERRQLERRQVLRYMQTVTATMQAARAPVLAGTDIGNPWIIPGFSLHDELVLFVEGGMSPLDALRAATINPARYLAATDSMGSIARGMIADIVLLDANPLDDIRSTTRIHAVVVNGRPLNRADLARMLAARAAAPEAR